MDDRSGHRSESTVRKIVDDVAAATARAAESEGCTLTITEQSFSPTVRFDPRLLDVLKTLLPSAPVLDTGAGHDAGILAPAVPSGIIVGKGVRVVTTKASLVAGEFAARAQAALPRLGDTDKRVVEMILNDPEAVVAGSVTELAQRVGVAQSSAVRACQRIGYRGYQDVKLAITRDLAQQERREQELVHEEGIDAHTPTVEILDRILRRSGRALVDAALTVDPGLLSIAIDRTAVASRVLVIGNGTSAAPAHDAAYRLSALGLVVVFPGDAMAQHLAARHLDESSVCLVISHTGASRETLQTAEAARAAGAFVLAITSFTSSPLTRVADASLVAGGAEYGFRLEAMASRLAHLGVIDALFVGIAVRRPKAASIALDIMADVTIEHSL